MRESSHSFSYDNKNKSTIKKFIIMAKLIKRYFIFYVYNIQIVL